MLNGKLLKDAVRHTNVMVSQNCFSHQCAGEPGENPFNFT